MTVSRCHPDCRADAGAGLHRRECNCPFCDYIGPSSVIAEWLTGEGGVFVIEPIKPVTLGHALVIPRRHVADALEDPLLTGEVMRLASVYARSLLHSGLHAFNIITSVGEPATQSVRHLHVHVVPRKRHDGLALPWTEG